MTACTVSFLSLCELFYEAFVQAYIPNKPAKNYAQMTLVLYCCWPSIRI